MRDEVNKESIEAVERLTCTHVSHAFDRHPIATYTYPVPSISSLYLQAPLLLLTKNLSFWERIIGLYQHLPLASIPLLILNDAPFQLLNQTIMRFLNTTTGEFVDRNPGETKYAILSHTWDPAGEQTYTELKDIQRRYGPRDRGQCSIQGTITLSSPPSIPCPDKPRHYPIHLLLIGVDFIL